MRIYLDNIAFNIQKAGGVSVYWSEIVKRSVYSGHNVTFIEKKKDINNIFRKQINISPSNITDQKYIPISISRYLPVHLNTDTPSIFHSSYFRICNNPKVLNVVTVHDCIYELFVSGFKQKLHLWQKKIALNKSDIIICVSESTKRDLLTIYPHLPSNKVKVIYNGAGDEFFPLEKQLPTPRPYEQFLRKKYILYVGSRVSYKNFNLIIDVVKQLKDFSLVVVGGGEFTDSEVHNLSQIKDRLFHVKSPSSNDLNMFYNYAYCLLYPSSYEGFGIPVAEAMKAGCPVITSSVSSIPEVAGNAGLLVDTISTACIIAKIQDLKNESYRNEIVKLGLIQGNTFSWDKCFRETIECYEHAYGNKFNP
ncbi:glycosyltransferase family 1 protein [Desulfuromonas sp. TF]|uniref:glycosyltransferase family 4 protein n=1 Tax=Desulfuromonas sp. TF TaxID=1232410 RepID=UPI00041CB20C|nr:glycosyltransferase family 1 protein [Desulfuromonas sp. TF]